MKKLKFNPMERAAGLFVLIAAGGAVLTAASVVVQKGYFEPKVRFFTLLGSSESVHVGTSVRMSGMKAGSVESVEMGPDGKVRVGFAVLKRFAARLGSDSRVDFVRASIIGEKQIELAPGSATARPIEPGATIAASESPDLMDAISGRQITNIVSNLDRITEGLSDLLGQSRNQKNAQKIMANLGDVSAQLKKTMTEFNESSPNFAREMSETLRSLSIVSRELAKVAPKLSAGADGIPAGTRKLVELMNESTTMIKAMQKSFLLRGSVADVKEEEAARAKAEAEAASSSASKPADSKPTAEGERAPASEPKAR